MAQNVFDATLDVNNNIKQNVFDWTHNNNLTTQLGRITPIFCDLLPAKSSFRVDPNFGMQFMPMVFPIQTSMRARVAFFRYPLRALWEDYTDFVGNLTLKKKIWQIEYYPHSFVLCLVELMFVEIWK